MAAAAEERIPQEDMYELGDEVRSGDHYVVWRARDRSLGAECYYHRFKSSHDLGERGKDRALAAMERYARLRAPRTPRYADAWLKHDGIVVIEFKTESKPMAFEKNNPLQGAERMTKGGLFDATLALLAQQHRCEFIHGSVRPGAFGIGPLGRIYLDDTGIDQSLAEIIMADDAQEFSLSQNVYGRDVAFWAFWMLSLAAGEMLHSEPHGFWDSVDLADVAKQLPRAVPAGAIPFFTECLTGFTPKGGRFDSAWEAWGEWKKSGLARLFE